jgi:hypothetical protein
LILIYPFIRRSILAPLAVATLCVPALVIVVRASSDPDPTTPLGRLLGAGTAQAASDQRAFFDQYGLEKFFTHPVLGDGWAWWIHNGYLQLAAAIGLIGFICYLMIIGSMLRPLMASTLPYRLLGLPALAAAMISAVDPWVGVRYIWCVVALALIAYRPPQGTSDFGTSRRPIAMSKSRHAKSKPAEAHPRS